ncbi:MAG: GntR family transcriptional regulator [Lachnospiraceae bacterium]|nr:GntR family transcriptional regulator [Lachnospiraceae bacterium]
MVTSNSAVPLYQQLAEELKKRIDHGEFRSGQTIPSEAKLCEQYKVSRITVRNAISELVDQEILVKYQGKGVFVRSPKISSSLTTFKGFTYFCQENHLRTYSKIIENKLIPAEAAMAKKLELEAGEKLVYLKRLRYVNDKPVMIEHVYLPYSKFGFLAKTDMENCSIYEKITEKTGLQIENNCYTSIMLETNITTEEEMNLMGLTDKGAVFILTETVFLNTGSPIHVTKQILLGNSFKFFMSNKVNQLSMKWEKI